MYGYGRNNLFRFRLLENTTIRMLGNNIVMNIENEY